MLLLFKRAVFDGLDGSIVESMKGLNILNRSCSCVKAFGFLPHLGDIKAYEDGVRPLNQCYEERVTDGNRNESAKEMHDSEKPWRASWID